MLTAASSMTDPYSGSVVADLAGFGALHGGAIEAVYKQLEAVGSVKNVPAFIQDVKDGKKRLFGYGHTKWKVSSRSCPPGPFRPFPLGPSSA